MTNEQIKARLNAIRKTAESLHGGGYSYDSGAPSEACWDVRWLLAHIDGLNLALNDAKVRLRVLGDSLGIERWLGQHKYRTVMHRHDGCWRAVDEASQLRLDADTFEELAEMLATLADGHKLTMAKPPNWKSISMATNNPKDSPVCVRFGCWRTPLKYMTPEQSHQTANGFFIIKISGYYCPRCGAGYGKKVRP